MKLSSKLPWMKFYPNDWIRDTRCLSLASRGIWIDLICILWESPERGQKTFPIEAWARSLSCTPAEITTFFSELAQTGVGLIATDEQGQISVTCRRLLREERARDSTRRRQQAYRERGGGNPTRWVAIRIRILERDNYTCGYCGRTAYTVDHILPKSRGGSHDDNNLVSCCKKCNFFKNNRTLEECGLTLRSPHSNSSKTVRSQMSDVRDQKSEEDEEKKLLGIPTPKNGHGKTAIPADLIEVPPDWQAWAKEKGCDRPGWEFQKFRDHALSHDRRLKDWAAGYRSWIRKSIELAKQGGRYGQVPNVR